jgi:hypothetical protein
LGEVRSIVVGERVRIAAKAVFSGRYYEMSMFPKFFESFIIQGPSFMYMFMFTNRITKNQGAAARPAQEPKPHASLPLLRREEGPRSSIVWLM